MAKVTPVVRVLYLYLFAMLGLVFMAVGGVQLIDMGLRAYVFKQADALERLDARREFVQPVNDKVVNDTAYQQWVAERRKIDPVKARRQRTAANSLALILVGLPIYLYHWRLIRRSSAKRQAAAQLNSEAG